MIFDLIREPITLEVRKSPSITKGRFYMIDYDYNGNSIWCPIFVIDDRYNTESQKKVIYAINLDYLKHTYKIAIFNLLFKSQENVIKYNVDANSRNENSLKEKPFKIDFESMYQILKKTGNFNYCITAFNYMKIKNIKKGSPEIYTISTLLIPRLMFMDTKPYNMAKMKQLSTTVDDVEKRQKLLELISTFENLIKDHGNDINEYYKRLKLLESKYELEK
jgi:hypothetical protein